MRYLSVCSGIEAATVAWHPLGWKAAAYSEIEKFPSQVLAHHYPDVPNVGDMTKFKEWTNVSNVDVLVGGTPCQSFSVAGLRKGLDDPRGNLMLTYLAIATKFRPKWLVWENVPGVLSSNGGLDFASLLRGMGECGYGFAYRILDAQYFGVAQRRRRVFVVGCLGDWRAAAAVLFERHSLSGYPAPSREKRKEVASSAGDGTQFCGLYELHSQDSRVRELDEVCTTVSATYGTGGGNIPITLMQAKNPMAVVAPTLTAANDPSRSPQSSEVTQQVYAVYQSSMAVRRLSPKECERLQGFPDNYTNIKDKCPDGPRYKALGNSMAVPVMAWIGKRIQEVENLQCKQNK